MYLDLEHDHFVALHRSGIDVSHVYPHEERLEAEKRKTESEKQSESVSEAPPAADSSAAAAATL